MMWTDSLSIGVTEIDDQHKELFKRIDAFNAALHTEKSKEETLKVLDFLSQYVVTHFRNEEAIQRRYNYPRYAEHHQIHEDFIKTVGEITEDIRKGGVTNIASSVVAMTLANWLVNHISIQDKALGKHIASLG